VILAGKESSPEVLTAFLVLDEEGFRAVIREVYRDLGARIDLTAAALNVHRSTLIKLVKRCDGLYAELRALRVASLREGWASLANRNGGRPRGSRDTVPRKPRKKALRHSAA
jgi:hypothetical protein